MRCLFLFLVALASAVHAAAPSRPNIETLRRPTSFAEANLILNSVVLLSDGRQPVWFDYHVESLRRAAAGP